MTHKINTECKVPETLLRQTVQRANNGQSADALMLSLAPYGLSEEQTKAIKEKLQKCAQHPDPHNAPELYNQLVDVINGNTAGTTQTVLQTNTNIGAITIVTPEPKETDIIITDQNCYILNLVDDIRILLFKSIINTKDFVAFAKTCSAMNTVFCLPEMHTLFTDMSALEMSIQLHNRWLDIYNGFHETGKALAQQKRDRVNHQLIMNLANSITQFALKSHNYKLYLIKTYGLSTASSPFEINQKCCKLFSCAAAKLEELHSDLFFIFAAKKLKLFKTISINYSGKIPDTAIKVWMDRLCNSICHDIVFSFTSQTLECITLDSLNKFINSMKEFLLNYDNVILSEEDEKFLKNQIIEAIIKNHSNEPIEQLTKKLNDLDINDSCSGFIFKTVVIHELYIEFSAKHQFIDDLNQPTIDFLVSNIEDKIIGEFGLKIDIDVIKEHVKALICQTFTREAIQYRAESWMQSYEYDIYQDEKMKAKAEFLMSLLQ